MFLSFLPSALIRRGRLVTREQTKLPTTDWKSSFLSSSSILEWPCCLHHRDQEERSKYRYVCTTDPSPNTISRDTQTKRSLRSAPLQERGWAIGIYIFKPKVLSFLVAWTVQTTTAWAFFNCMMMLIKRIKVLTGWSRHWWLWSSLRLLVC